MRATRIDNEYLYYLIYGSGYIDNPWSHLWGSNQYYNDHWELFVRPVPRVADVGFVDMSNQDDQNIATVFTQSYAYNPSGTLVYTTDDGTKDARTADRLSLDHNNVGAETSFKLALQGVEFIDAPVDNLQTHLQIITKDGFVTDGTLASLTMHIGHQEMTFTGAARDSTIFMGAGYDTIDFIDHLDVPGEQFWAVIRRDDGELDAYSLFSGFRVQLGSGYKGWTAAPSDLRNYGEIEEISLRNSRFGGTDVYLPGVDLPNGGDRGTATNIDLRSDGMLHSDSFNLAYFNFIRYTSDNVWAGEATIHDGTETGYSTPSDRTVTMEKYSVQAPVLAGTMSVIGSSRNGTHDLIVAEQDTAIDGQLRVYSFNVASGLYNDFNEVYLGSAEADTADKSGIVGTDWSDRVALYGFGGNDVLTGGFGRDYIFGGQSVYNQLNVNDIGNIVTGGIGADYFGVGNTNSAGVVTGSNVTLTGDFLQGFATDVIMDWHAGQDTLVVLSNGVAVVGGLFGVSGMMGNDTIDLRAVAAIATSDQDGDGARGGSEYRVWDSSTDLNYTFERQGLRDAESIANEADITVVNDGIIVSRGLGGNDTIWGSVGIDYVYGGDGKNYLYLGNDTDTDRAFIDQFVGMQIIRDFTNGEDKIYLNVDAIFEAHDRIDHGPLQFNRHGGQTPRDPYQSDWVQNSAATSFTFGRPSEFGLDLGAVGIIYFPWTQVYLAQLNTGVAIYSKSNGAWRNSSHKTADSLADIALGVAGGIAVAGGTAMLFNPFTAPIGAALIVTGSSQIAAAIISEPHFNAVYQTPHHLGEYYVNYLTAARTVTTTFSNDDTPLFTDFFWDPNVSTTFAKAVEFQDTSSPNNFAGITTFAVLHSNMETFIYYVQSEDHIITDDEARLVAEIESIVPITDLVGYLGDLDIYNQTGVVTPIYPKSVDLEATVDVGTVSASGRIKDSSIDLTMTLAEAPNVGDVLEVFEGSLQIATISTVAGTMSYTFTHSFAPPASGGEKVLNYRVVSKSSQGFTTSSETVTLIYDNQAPEIVTLSIDGANTLSVIISGYDISEDELAHVRLKEGDDIVASVSVDASYDPVELTVPTAPTGFFRTFLVEVVDARGNAGTDPTKIYALSNEADVFEIVDSGAITFGFGGNDHIIGTDGSDIIVGGAGNDTLFGGAGQDLFVFESTAAGNGVDTFGDFSAGVDGDKLDFSKLGSFSLAYDEGWAVNVAGDGQGTDATGKIIQLWSSASNSSVDVDEAFEIAGQFGNALSIADGGKAIIISGEDTSAQEAFIWYVEDTNNDGNISASEVTQIAFFAELNVTTLTSDNFVLGAV